MHEQNFQTLLYWIKEREIVRLKKEHGDPKPWSEDPVFQTTYFCNVDRENDTVTKWIRNHYSAFVDHPLFTENMILARLLNWPPTLEIIGYQEEWVPSLINVTLHREAKKGKIWGSAYVVTTHGIQMNKIDYLTERVMPSAWHNVDGIPDGATCREVSGMLQNVEGISTFMAGQVIADLKNTPGHPLRDAPDWLSFALPGPGSRRGMNWLHDKKISDGQWLRKLHELQDVLLSEHYIELCAQNLQNCLCEYDKYMRVSNGTGRSKRKYPGL